MQNNGYLTTVNGKFEVTKGRSFYGRIEQYVPGECFQSYRELAEEFFLTNNIEGNMKRSFLIRSLGSIVYNKLRTHLYPRNPTKCNIDVILEALETYYSPSSHTLPIRYKFFKLSQDPGESIANYVIRIKNLAEKCEFGNFIPKDLSTTTSTELYTLALEDALLSKLIIGLLDSKIQQSLLETSNLTFKTAVDLATNIEMSKWEQERLRISRSTYKNTHRETQSNNKSPSLCRSSSQRSSSRSKIVDSQSSIKSSVEGKCIICGRQGATHTYVAN